MKPTGANYDIVKGNGNTEELEQYRKCFINNGSPRELDNLIWLHQQNLTRDNTIFYAMDADQIAAIYTALPVIFNINGIEKPALQSIDTITDEKHRGQGLFPKLAKRLYEKAAEDHYSFVYGFPNENSAPGFFKKLGWTSFGEAPFIVKPLSIGYVIKKALKLGQTATPENENFDYTLPGKKLLKNNDYIHEIKEFGTDYDSLWKLVSELTPVCINRNASYMNWRYVNKPGFKYSLCGYYKDNKLVGIVVFTIRNKHQGRVGYIMDLIYDPADNTIGKHLLNYAKDVCKKNNSDILLAWCFKHSFNFTAYSKSGFYDFPIRFRPQHLFLGVRSFDDDNKGLVENANNWYISYSDSDTV